VCTCSPSSAKVVTFSIVVAHHILRTLYGDFSLSTVHRLSPSAHHHDILLLSFVPHYCVAFFSISDNYYYQCECWLQRFQWNNKHQSWWLFRGCTVSTTSNSLQSVSQRKFPDKTIHFDSCYLLGNWDLPGALLQVLERCTK